MAKIGEYKDITGQRFGRLVALNFAHKRKNIIYWNCICDCGNETIVQGALLRRGHTQSCGCLQKERTIKAKTKHSLSNHRLSMVWSDIKDRCLNKKGKRFQDYGGRGITICDEWKNNFKAFYDWAIESGYKEELLSSGINKWTIDRINNNGNYEPSNCRWVTRKEQNNNTRRNIPKEIKEKKCHFCHKTFIAKSTNSKFCSKNCLELFKSIVWEFNGKSKTISQWSKKTNIGKHTLFSRYYRGWSIEKILTTPLKTTREKESKLCQKRK